ncbi:MAG: hypothetical protein IPK87_07740 [Planctomycetes bacterium]|nr:hypothetical protein [Planctomycetota bacterium]
MQSTLHTWLAHTALVLCCLAGAVFTGHTPTYADENPAKAQPRGPWVVRDAKSAADMPEGTRSLLLRSPEDLVTVLKALPTNTTVSTVTLEDCTAVGDDALRALCDACASLSTLSFRNCDVANVGGLVNAKRIRMLHFERCAKFNGAGLASLAPLSARNIEGIALGVTGLSIDDCASFGAAGMAEAAALSHLFSLVLVNLPALKPGDFSALAASDAEVLNLVAISAANAQAMREVAKMSHLERLTCSKCANIDNKAVEALAGHKTLERLSLKQCGVHTGIGPVVGLLPALKALALGAPVDLDESDFVAMGEQPNLQELSVTDCRHVTDEMLAVLAANSKITLLDLSRCTAITDDGLMSLASIKTLTYLRIGGISAISEEVLQALKVKLPELRVDRQ